MALNEKETKIITKVQTFDDVTKSLQEIEKRLNALTTSTNSDGEGEVDNTEGKTGDIRITQGADKDYTFEVMTEEGWKFGSVGESPVTFTDKPAEFSKPDAIVNKFKDELGKAKNFPAPDYDSGWVNVADEGTYAEHGLGAFPTAYQVLFTPDYDSETNEPTTVHYYLMDYNDGGNTFSCTTTQWRVNGWSGQTYGYYYNGPGTTDGGTANYTGVTATLRLRVQLWK